MSNPLSLHISGPNGRRDRFGEWLQQLTAAGTPAPLLYSVNQNLADDLRRYSPTTKWIYRLQNDTFARVPGNLFAGDPRSNARHWLTGLRDGSGRTQVETWALNAADWCDPLNEPVPQTQAEAQWINEWMLEALEIAHQRGFKLALYSFSTGRPEYNLWQYLIPSLQLGGMYGAVLSLHAYNDGGLVERDAAGHLTPAALHNSFRHWQIYEDLPESARLPIVYSEASAGNGFGTGFSAAQWIADLIAYGQIMKDDPYVAAVCAYQLGGNESNCYQALMDYGGAIVTADWSIEPTEPPADESQTGEFAAAGLVLFDATGANWRLGTACNDAGYAVLKDNVQHAGGWATALLYFQHAVYATNAMGEWYKATANGWQKTDDPRRDQIIIEPEPVERFFVSWPIASSETPRITSRFNEPRDYGNGKHEGLDGDGFDNLAGKNAIVVAAQDGIVEMVRQRTDSPSYGRHVVIVHPWGAERARYRTLYAHLDSVSVKQGQSVTRGQPIGVAGATGTSAIHLHFGVYDAVAGLKGYVRCADCSATWPDGVIDPERVLRYDNLPEPPIPPISTAWRGLQLRADGHSQPADFECLRVAKLDAAKIMTNTGFEELAQLVRVLNPGKIVLRLFADFRGRVVQPADFYDWQRAWLGEFVRNGGRYVEVHNEPNLEVEGLGSSWAGAPEFALWFTDVARRIRAEFPTVMIGWPGLSPQPNVPAFSAALQTLLQTGLVDWIGAHAYWQNAAGVDSAADGRYYRRFLGMGKPVLITEFSNVGTVDDDATKGAQYKRFYSTLETGVLGAFAFVSSASDATFNQRRETWARNGQLSAIPAAVGA